MTIFLNLKQSEKLRVFVILLRVFPNKLKPINKNVLQNIYPKAIGWYKEIGIWNFITKQAFIKLVIIKTIFVVITS